MEITVDKQLSIRIKDYLVNRLDHLSASGGVNRHHLMLMFVNLWLVAFKESSHSRLFYVSCLLRVHEGIHCDKMNRYQLGFNETGISEKSLPIKLSRDVRFIITGYSSRNHISSHLLLKTMIIVGLEVLEDLTEKKPYQLETIEPILFKEFINIINKGGCALEAYRK